MRLSALYEVPVEELTSKVEITPSVAQTLEDNVQQSAAFLGFVNIVPVPEKPVRSSGWVSAQALPVPRTPPKQIAKRQIRLK